FLFSPGGILVMVVAMRETNECSIYNILGYTFQHILSTYFTSHVFSNIGKHNFECVIPPNIAIAASSLNYNISVKIEHTGIFKKIIQNQFHQLYNQDIMLGGGGEDEESFRKKLEISEVETRKTGAL
ncbi:hypothetical protein ACJX0J_016610, partial [Zea mays]